MVELLIEQVIDWLFNVLYNYITTNIIVLTSKGDNIMNKISISNNITNLRKKKGITQEQLAVALNISPQAVSKWETCTSLPDTQILPLIANYFNVSIDYLFYGQDLSYDEIYEKVFKKISAHEQMSKTAYEDTLTIFGYAHNGITRGNLKDKSGKFYDEPSHITNHNGVSLMTGKGYGAIITRSFFENINMETANFASTLLPVLSIKECFLICMAIMSMNDISYGELKNKLGYDDETLRKSLNSLIDANLVIETESRHPSLGLTYEISSMYYTCLCIIFATIEIQRFSLKGISCCMEQGDFSIDI